MAHSKAPISVIIPAYNAASTLAASLDSVFAQTLSPSEVIVFDDGSTDATAALAAQAGAKVIRSTNLGLARARNAAIEQASSEWIALLDADDLWHPRKLELQYEFSLQVPDLDLIGCDFDRINAQGIVRVADVICQLRQYAALAPIRVSEWASICDPETLTELLAAWGIFLPSAAMFRRSFALRLGGFDPNTLSEDSEFFLRCVAAGRAGIVELPLVAYVESPKGITAQRSDAVSRLDLSERVLARPALYHPASVRALRTLLPGLAFRIMLSSAANGSTHQALRAFRSLCRFPPSVHDVAGAVIRLLARYPVVVPLLKRLPYTRQVIEKHTGRSVSALTFRDVGFDSPWRRGFASAAR